MQKYSETWRHLKSILNGYNPPYVPPPDTDLEHIRARTLAIFFANASLATPRLDRGTVEEILNGTLRWPCVPEMESFSGSNVPLALLEEYGLVTFYAGWCVVQCQPVRHPEKLDPSLLPLFESLEHLRDICYGRDGYVRPHFACPEGQLDQLVDAYLLANTLSDDGPVRLRKESGNYVVTSNTQIFDPLVSTYLWQELRSSLEPEQAFQRWILCACVSASWSGTDLLFDHLPYEERGKFTEQLLAFLAEDVALARPLDALWMQYVAAGSFAHNISTAAHVDVQIDLKTGSVSNSTTSTIPKITLDNLADVFPPHRNLESELLTVREWYHNHQLHRDAGLFYTILLGSVIEAHIRIDGESLTSYVGIEDLFELTESRPILKHILLHALPSHQHPTFLIWLLSRPSTCDIALFHLSIHSPIYRGREEKSFARNLDKAYQESVCKEYLCTLFDECRDNESQSRAADRLLAVLHLLATRCGLDANDFSNSFEYQFLICLLGELSEDQIVQVAHSFVKGAGPNRELWWRDRSEGRSWYLLAFWLIESLERTASESLSSELRRKIEEAYGTDFRENFSERQTLRPNAFFASLPWHFLLGQDSVSPLLILSSGCDSWHAALSYSNKNNAGACSAIRHYLQVLMNVGRPQYAPKNWQRVAGRIIEIVRAVGFAKGQDSTHLFVAHLYGDTYDLWPTFCSYTNLCPDQIFDDFVDRLCPYVPLDHLFVLLEHCTIVSRAEQVQQQIISRPADSGDLGLTGLEQAFLSACHSGHSLIAEDMLGAAKKFMEERFVGVTNPLALEKRKLWETYEYKLQLIKLHEGHKDRPDDFREAVLKVDQPHAWDARNSHVERAEYKECERFRRYILAAAYCDSDAEKCITIMEQLCREVSSNQYEFLLFAARSVKASRIGNIALQKQALAQFLSSLQKTEPDDLPSAWAAAILNAYRFVRKYAEIDGFWERLNPDQQTRPEVLEPYCRALVDRGEPLRAQQIVLLYTELNPQGVTSDIGKLLDEIAKAVPEKQSMSELVRVVAEQSQRSVLQLRKHYNDIKASDLKTYVEIVGQGVGVQEFLKDAVLEVAKELLLRRKNLQLLSEESSNKLSADLVEEDLINDWFTSLFEHRMAHAGLSLSDQKRAGKSGTGAKVGEADGFIKHSNTRVAIYEAFKLTCLDTTVIRKHLNKIAGYDSEALSPVFIAGYCNAPDFPALTRKYAQFIEKEDYVGFAASSAGTYTVEALRDSGDLWVGKELRLRNHEEIVIYHFLLNMGC
jgi:hypothetical protein